MSNISSGRMSTPTFQPANSKGDGGGNGSGGMFFGGGQEEQQQPENPFQEYTPEVEIEDIPFNKPLFGEVSSAMKLWKKALAVRLYADIHRIEFEKE